MEADAAVELALAWPHDLVRLGERKGNEQQSWLVDVAVVPIDDVDLQLVLVHATAEVVGEQRAAGAAAEDDESLRHGSSFAGPCERCISSRERPACGQLRVHVVALPDVERADARDARDKQKEER